MKLKILVLVFLISNAVSYSVAQDSDNWEFIGPDDVSSIKGIGNEPGSPIFTYSLTENPTIERVYRSVEGDPPTWEVIFEEPRGPNFVTLDLLVYSSSIYFLATSTGVLRTIDSGLNWSPTSLGDLRINDLAMTDDGRIAACGAHKYYLSVDDGDTWTSSTVNLQSDLLSEITFDENGGTWCLDNKHVYLSTDDGETWSIKFTTETTLVVPSQLAVDSRGHIFFCDVDTFGGLTVVYRSVDNGDTWEYVLVTLAAREMLATRTGSIYLVSGESILLSTDGGDSWGTAYTREAFSVIPRSLHISSIGRMFVGTTLGIFRSKFLLPGFNGAGNWNSYP